MGAIEFIQKIAVYVVKEAKARGYKYPSAIIAQACLESGFGGSGLSAKYHNYFGMKCGSSWKGKSVNLATKEEFTRGTLTTISDNFRVYDSMEEGVKGYFDFINTKRYANLKDATSYEDYLNKIRADGYATSFVYVQSCMKLIRTYELNKYDNIKVIITDDKPKATTTSKKKTVTEIANEVIKGLWGNGDVRKRKLEEAGYDYIKVQKKVNQILKG